MLNENKAVNTLTTQANFCCAYLFFPTQQSFFNCSSCLVTFRVSETLESLQSVVLLCILHWLLFTERKLVELNIHVIYWVLRCVVCKNSKYVSLDNNETTASLAIYRNIAETNFWNQLSGPPNRGMWTFFRAFVWLLISMCTSKLGAENLSWISMYSDE